jgi:hypothetical protein
MTTNKPRFRCPFETKRKADGTFEFHVTTRDGGKQILSGPPGVTQLTSNVEIYQPEGSDDVRIVLASGGSTSTRG